MNGPSGIWPPRPPLPPQPLPPEPPPLPRTPWQPEPRPAAPGPASASASVVISGDSLADRLLDQRVIALAGELDAETVNRAVGSLALLDASGDDPVQLRLSGVSADLDAALTLVDAIDLVGAPVHATCLGTLTGPAVALLAIADSRVVAAHAFLHLTEPRVPHQGLARELETQAAERAHQLHRLQERLAEACGRDVEQIAADMRAGRMLDDREAGEYGLADPPQPSPRRAGDAPTG
jgi:ATP-dependent Clp protease protease subunit